MFKQRLKEWLKKFVYRVRGVFVGELNDKLACLNSDLNHKLARLEYETYQLKLTQIVQDCVENKEHKQICYAILQQLHCVGRLSRDNRFVIDFSPAVASTIDAYLKLLQPAKLDHLIRVGGKSDGGYVMLDPATTRERERE
ncbi:hypothetical protein [Helicobacter suis]|uniref:hypothetical protein n=1 Tax=Helicobacter suis TaxID=104628 RepID=UPI0013CF6271|nr:hypothetical protein [Helicobacter suis]